MARLVALLRGINLGAKRRVAMADLRALLEEIGYTDVRTVLRQRQRRPHRAEGEGAREARAGARGALRHEDRRDPAHDEGAAGGRRRRPVRRRGRRTRRATSSSSSTPAPNAAPLGRCWKRTSRPTSSPPNGRELYAWCPDGHAEQPPDEGARQAGAGGDRDRPQLGAPSTSCWSRRRQGCCAC